jgi:uncharacterized membrane protein YeaQ/YmgE (transglycosylase-associated protein family)
MELLFVVLGGAILGIVSRYSVPRRDLHGALLVPAVGAIAAAVAWAALTWVGWKFDGGWIWVVSLIAAVTSAVLVSVLLGRTRTARDTELLSRLSHT